VRRGLALALAAVVSLTVVRPARAQESAACEARLQLIVATLDADARRTRTWYWSWMAIGGGLLAGQAALALVTTGDEQKDFVAGAATSVFIPGMLLVHAPRVLDAAPLLDARLAATTVDGRVGDPCIALPRAEELLDRAADDQALATGWFAHAFVIGGNIAVGLLLGLGFHDWLGAAKQVVGGSIVGEVQILTLPTGALTLRGAGIAGSF